MLEALYCLHHQLLVAFATIFYQMYRFVGHSFALLKQPLHACNILPILEILQAAWTLVVNFFHHCSLLGFLFPMLPVRAHLTHHSVHNSKFLSFKSTPFCQTRIAQGLHRVSQPPIAQLV